MSITASTPLFARSAWCCGMTPEKPRFVETVVGKGYRFAAPVTCNNGDSNPQVQPPPLVQAPAVPSVKERVLSLRIETLPRRVYRFVGAVTGRLGNGTEPTAMAEEKPDAAEKPARQLGIGARLVTVGLMGLTVAATLLLALECARYARPTLHTAHESGRAGAGSAAIDDLPGDPEQEYFADGMTEALITELGKISAPRVISRQSIMQYKGSKKGLSEIAGELNVDAILEGTVERFGDRVPCSSAWTRFRQRVNSGPTNTTATSATICGYRIRLRVRSRTKSKSN